MKRLVLMAGLSFCVFGAPAPLTLAQKGRTTYTIVTAKEASPSERRGAADCNTSSTKSPVPASRWWLTIAGPAAT